MNHLKKFNEHVYTKAASTDGKKWMENFRSLIKYLKNQIENRQLRNFKKDDSKIEFSINGRKYMIDIDGGKISLIKKSKGSDVDVSLDITKDQVDMILDALKKPLKSPKAEDQGRKPYLS